MKVSQWSKSDSDTVSELRELLEDVANQLDEWAKESERGGWSTHQVKPQRKLADKIRRILS